METMTEVEGETVEEEIRGRFQMALGPITYGAYS